MLTAAGRFVRVEQRDPDMGPNARLDILEVPSARGGSAAYDVSVVTPFRDDTAFVAACAREPGHAAAFRHRDKLERQYAERLPGSRLVPLVVEVGGRWHPSVPRLVRSLARAYVEREPGLPAGAEGAVVSRWAARLSAHLIRGCAACVRDVLPGPPTAWPGEPAHGLGLPQCRPDGHSAYELLVG